MIPGLEPKIPSVHWATTLSKESELVMVKKMPPCRVILVVSAATSPFSLKTISLGSTSWEFAVQVIFNWSGTIRLRDVAMKMIGTTYK